MEHILCLVTEKSEMPGAWRQRDPCHQCSLNQGEGTRVEVLLEGLQHL